MVTDQLSLAELSAAVNVHVKIGKDKIEEKNIFLLPNTYSPK